MMTKTITKRDGKVVPFNVEKIAIAIGKAFAETKEPFHNGVDATILATLVASRFDGETVEIEEIQNAVEDVLITLGYAKTAKAYILYRQERTRQRDMNSRLMHELKLMTEQDAKQNETLRENANVNGDSPMGYMLKAGAETTKEFARLHLLKKEHADAHTSGEIHIHDLDFYPTGTQTCSQIDLTRLFENGFSTGHGYLRKPNSIGSFSALAAIAIQANQNDQHGGQSIPNLDRMLSEGVAISYKKIIRQNIEDALAYNCDFSSEKAASLAEDVIKTLEDKNIEISLGNKDLDMQLWIAGLKRELGPKIVEKSKKKIERECYQAMEAFIHNLNTMNSRAGAQVPFSSVNYGTDTSPEGRMIVKNILLATEAGLGNGETPIFPIQIFRMKKGINMEPGDPNYDLFQLACRVSAKRLFPNFSFQDAPYNLQYYKEGCPETEIAYMGCRTRVIGNVNGPEISYGRGNLSFTSINLPRLGIEAAGDWDKFYEMLDEKLALVRDQLLERFEYQCRKHAYNFPFTIGQGVWNDGEKIKPTDEIREVIKQGSLGIGFIGLAETLKAMMGVHHGESDEAYEKGLEIIKYMRAFTDKCIEDYHLNFSLLATPAEGLSGRFVKIDAKKYGVIEGVTDRDYYTNSFHVPVYYNISAYEKVLKEGPFHALTNGGHISYIELDGDPSENLPAFEKIVRCMAANGIGYGAINHPVDRDPVCGYSGIIGDVCPKCGRKENENGIPFDRIRRITGYLVGTLDRFNNGKRAEEHDRVKHGI